MAYAKTYAHEASKSTLTVLAHLSMAERGKLVMSGFYAFQTRLFIVPNIVDNSTRDGLTLMTQ